MVMSSSANYKEGDVYFKRIKKNINREWRFILGDPENKPYQENYMDQSWERVGLPHTFSLPYFRSEKFYVGYGWYRKNLRIEKEWISKNLELEFDGVFQVAEIYINGKKVGEHQGGYTGFTVNISKYVKQGDNSLAIKVNNIWNPQIAPRAGEHVFSGGIYRDVYLTVTAPLHVIWNGTFVTTPVVSKEKAIVNVKTEIKNSGSTIKECTVKTVVVDSFNNEIAKMESKLQVGVGEVVVFDQTSEEIKNPNLWSPDAPHLYKVKTFVFEKLRMIDSYESKFGFRWFEWTADKGFFLNGEHLYLEGVNVHQDHAGWGDAVTQAGIYRDLKLMKDAGFNFIRGSHYPHHPFFTTACDQLGLIFIPENCVWGIGGFKDDGYWDSSAYPIHKKDQKPYEESAAKSLEELIRINRNSPSIMAWSMSNEPFFTADSVVYEMKNMLVHLVDRSHQLDPTRPALIGGAQRKNVDVLGDLAGYNGDGATLYREPGFPSIVSEYGSCVADRPGEYIPCWGAVSNGEKPEWRSGHAIWCGFDHGSIAGKMGKMGIVDFARIPKRSWYWYRNYFKNIPPPAWPQEGIPEKLELYADKNVIRGTDATDDVHVHVKVVGKNGKHISNSPDVTLTIVSGPGEFPTGRSITFRNTTENDIQILDGHAAIEFRTYEGGETMIKATSPGLKEYMIKITTLGKPEYVEGQTKISVDRSFKGNMNNFQKRHTKSWNISNTRPTRNNSAGSSNASLANDGDPSTIWRPETEKKNLWWQVDLENFYQVTGINILFSGEIGCECRVKISDDQENWHEISRGKKNPGDGRKVKLKSRDQATGRFLRIFFSPIQGEENFGIREIEVRGRLPLPEELLRE